jgi:HAD superfamily hydrolase (TIGR01509 family)
MHQSETPYLDSLSEKVSLPRHPRAVVFDFDGVVLDSLGTHIEAWDNACFHLFQIRISAELKRSIRGEATIDIARMICAAVSRKGAESALMFEKNKQLLLLGSTMGVISGLQHLISDLQRVAIPFGVASNAPYAFLKRCITEMQLPFLTYLGRETVVNPKPAPDLFIACAERLGVSESDFDSVVCFEDSLHGVQAILSAGMRPVGISSNHGKDILISEGALLALNDYNDLIVKASL